MPKEATCPNSDRIPRGSSVISPRRDGLLTEFTRPLGFYSREDANVYRNTCLSAERASYHDVVHIDDINKETAR
jgi:hypothetical protein